MCWGQDGNGQIGNGTTGSPQLTPTSVINLPQIDASFWNGIAAGGHHTCALMRYQLGNLLGDAATVMCWGANNFGQIGDATTIQRPTPTTVANAFAISNTEPTQIVAGDDHNCVVGLFSDVWCWGKNSNGQIGIGNTATQFQPIIVPGLTNVHRIAAGGSSTCALLDDGTVACWGYNAHGNLGDGTTVDRYVPTTVPGLTGVVDISVSGTHTCAVRSNGTVACWGQGSLGVLGNGDTSDRYVPTDVLNLSGVVRIAAGGDHTCAVRQDSTVVCWGWNFTGQLGDGTTGNFKANSAPISTHCIGDIAQFDGANDIICDVLDGAIAVDGGPVCWGTNNPISAGDHSTCAALKDGGIVCWGANSVGQVGDGTTTTRALPTSILSGISGANDALCCTDQQGTGCERVSVEGCVCAIDPYCCTNQWDDQCAQEGASSTCWSSMCGNGIIEPGEQCDPPNDAAGCNQSCQGDPCVARLGPRSANEGVTNCVCAFDAFCCDNRWDVFCVGEAQASCGLQCP
jgi:alpha-tubulin suppressor-like RCC1 family protein